MQRASPYLRAIFHACALILYPSIYAAAKLSHIARMACVDHPPLLGGYLSRLRPYRARHRTLSSEGAAPVASSVSVVAEHVRSCVEAAATVAVDAAVAMLMSDPPMCTSTIEFCGVGGMTWLVLRAEKEEEQEVSGLCRSNAASDCLACCV